VTSVPRQVIIGLDVGTTGVKAVGFGLDGLWRTLAVRQYPLLRQKRATIFLAPKALGAAPSPALGLARRPSAWAQPRLTPRGPLGPGRRALW
jgi:hypothetical protein